MHNLPMQHINLFLFGKMNIYFIGMGCQITRTYGSLWRFSSIRIFRSPSAVYSSRGDQNHECDTNTNGTVNVQARFQMERICLHTRWSVHKYGTVYEDVLLIAQRRSRASHLIECSTDGDMQTLLPERINVFISQEECWDEPGTHRQKVGRYIDSIHISSTRLIAEKCLWYLQCVVAVTQDT